ncbi:hypothetical protein C3K47_14025 [Solitalea longa]|uniref:Uncharacterized protein n=1 Tax=Solitalea longa TaxID=2079460 RepID=A0A2S5A0T2_9SPHI|nr:hypothetical protein [Solitalea longa]POY35862.1 hypothetical protein C3K47_14025 [Solitalea longa]
MENLKVNTDAIMLSTLLSETLYKVDEWNQNDRAQTIQNTPVAEETVTQVAEQQATVAAPETNAGFEYLGENNRYVLVLVNYPNSKYITDKDKEFFLKVIAALKMSLDDVAVLNYAHCKNADLTALKNFFSCSKVIGFDLPSDALVFKGLNMHDYATTNFSGMSIMRSPDTLSAIEADKNKKMVLWNALKLLFNVK